MKASAQRPVSAKDWREVLDLGPLSTLAVSLRGVEHGSRSSHRPRHAVDAQQCRRQRSGAPPTSTRCVIAEKTPFSPRPGRREDE